MTDPSARLVLACGHESGSGIALFGASDSARVVPADRGLGLAVEESLRVGSGPVCVLPMTLGRDPRLIADSARALRWAANSGAEGAVVLAEPFGTTTHLVGWLRAAAVRPPVHAGERRALLITAPSANPFDDAELFRLARLVRQYSGHRLVEVALAGGDPDVEEGLDRCRRLGAKSVRTVPAGFASTSRVSALAAEYAEDGGPLLTLPAIRGVIHARVEAALTRLAEGDNGIGSGLHAEHGYGYAHTHFHSCAQSKE